MSLIEIIFALIFIGILLYAINAFIPMEATMKKILNGVVIIVVLLWLMKLMLGLWPAFHHFHL